MDAYSDSLEIFGENTIQRNSINRRKIPTLGTSARILGGGAAGATCGAGCGISTSFSDINDKVALSLRPVSLTCTTSNGGSPEPSARCSASLNTCMGTSCSSTNALGNHAWSQKH